MSIKKVIYLLEHWLPPGTPGSTGGTLYNYQFVEALAQLFDVEVIALHAPVCATPDRVKLTVFKERRTRLRRWRFANWRATLMAQLPKDGSETLLVTTTATNAVIQQAKRRGFTTLAIVQAYEDFGFAVPSGSLRDRLHGLKRLLATAQDVRPEIRHADRVVVNSEYMKRITSESLACRRPMCVLYPPLTLPVVLAPAFGQAAMDKVGFVNRAGKNLSFVLALARATPEREFLIYGHPIPQALELPANVVVRGWASDRQRMFLEAATWIMPSSWSEPFGLVAVEALSQGCRVGVSGRGGLPEAVGAEGKVFGGFDLIEWRDWLMAEREVIRTKKREQHLRLFKMESFSQQAAQLIYEACSPTRIPESHVRRGSESAGDQAN